MTAAFRAEVEDTYAEAFRSIYAEFLITARDRKWLDHAVAAATGNASSTILCDCEAGLDRRVADGIDPTFSTPDGRPGAIVQFHVPRFRKDRREALERALLVRIFEHVGDESPMHSHPVGQEHMTFVNSGTFYMWGPAAEPDKPGWERTCGPGTMMVFEADKPHAIRALTAGAKLTNIPF